MCHFPNAHRRYLRRCPRLPQKSAHLVQVRLDVRSRDEVGPHGRCQVGSGLELQHRRRARCEDRIRAAKATGVQNLPLHGFDQNRIWLAIVQLARELVTWTQMLALAGRPARCWEPNVCGCDCGRSLDGSPVTPAAPWSVSPSGPSVEVLTAALDRVDALPTPA